MKLKRPKTKFVIEKPINFDGDGLENTCFHFCVMSNRARLQVNANDVFYSKDVRQLRKLAKIINQAADYLRDNNKRER